MEKTPAAAADAGAAPQDPIITVDTNRIRVVGIYTLRCKWNNLTDTSVKKLPGASDTAASFEFAEEDHTLGNALRYMIMKKSVKTLIRVTPMR